MNSIERLKQEKKWIEREIQKLRVQLYKIMNQIEEEEDDE